MQSGDYQLYPYSLSTHFEEDMVLIEKWHPQKHISAVYYDGSKKEYFVKRFFPDIQNKKVPFITEHDDSFLERAVVDKFPILELTFAKVKSGNTRDKEQLNLYEFIAVKGVKALGNRLSAHKVKNIEFLDPLEDDTDYDATAAAEPEAEPAEETAVEAASANEVSGALEEEEEPAASKVKTGSNKGNKDNGESQIKLDL